MSRRSILHDFFAPQLQEVRELTLGEHDLVIESAVVRRRAAWDDHLEFFGIVLRSTEPGLIYGQRVSLTFWVRGTHPKFAESMDALLQLARAARSLPIAHLRRDLLRLESEPTRVHYGSPALRYAATQIQADVRAVATKPLRHAWPQFSELQR